MNKDVGTKEQIRQQKQQELFKEQYEELKRRWETDRVKFGQDIGLKTFDLGKI